MELFTPLHDYTWHNYQQTPAGMLRSMWHSRHPKNTWINRPHSFSAPFARDGPSFVKDAPFCKRIPKASPQRTDMGQKLPALLAHAFNRCCGAHVSCFTIIWCKMCWMKNYMWACNLCLASEGNVTSYQ